MKKVLGMKVEGDNMKIKEYKVNIKDKKNILIGMICIILTIVFFSYSIVVTYDSAHYLWLTSIFNRSGFYDWDVIRGFFFPACIKICGLLFGQSIMGLKVGMFAMYSVMIITTYLIYRDVIEKEKIAGNKFKFFTIILFLILIALNPIIFGYYHTLLTEFMAMTFSIIGCYLSYKWININFENKVKYIIFTLVFSILTCLAWQLKQPYVGTILFPLIISTIISIIQKFNKKNILAKIVTVLIVIISLFGSLKLWNYILRVNNVQFKESRTSSSQFSNSLIDRRFIRI